MHHLARHRRNLPTRNAGFTAVELMVVVAIVAMLAAVALPSFRSVVAKYRVRQAIEDLSASIYHARVEAIKRGGSIVFSKATAAGCTATAHDDWSCGWLVFVDADGNGDPTGDQVLQTSPLPKGVTVQFVLPGVEPFVRVDGWGTFAYLGAFSFQVTPTGSADPGLPVRLCMASGGRLREVRGAQCD